MRPASTAFALSRTALRRAGHVVALTWALIPAPHTAAQDTSHALSERLSQTISRRMARDNVPGVVVVLLEDGSPVWTGAFGLADPRTGRAMTENALFRVESISKPVTAWGAMRLSETRRLDLDVPVTDCLPDWRPPGGLPSITARQLLSHTAGVGLGDYAERFPPDRPRPDLPTHLSRDFTTIAPPGTRFSYSDTGFSLLELTIETCTGEDFAALLERDVLAPLGMERASFDWTEAEMPVGHDLRGAPVAPYVYPGRASGGLHATARDIARFAAAGMDGAVQDVLSQDAVAELHRPGVEVDGLFGFAADGYGLGHFSETLSDGRAAVWHWRTGLRLDEPPSHGAGERRRYRDPVEQSAGLASLRRGPAGLVQQPRRRARGHGMRALGGNRGAWRDRDALDRGRWLDLDGPGSGWHPRELCEELRRGGLGGAHHLAALGSSTGLPVPLFDPARPLVVARPRLRDCGARPGQRGI